MRGKPAAWSHPLQPERTIYAQSSVPSITGCPQGRKQGRCSPSLRKGSEKDALSSRAQSQTDLEFFKGPHGAHLIQLPTNPFPPKGPSNYPASQASTGLWQEASTSLSARKSEHDTCMISGHGRGGCHRSPWLCRCCVAGWTDGEVVWVLCGRVGVVWLGK